MRETGGESDPRVVNKLLRDELFRLIERRFMDWTLEVVVIPVTDVDRSKRFYTEQLGFNIDDDLMWGPVRVVQLAPPGSACSITIGPLVVDEVAESSARFQLVVNDIEAARRELLDRGVEVSEVQQWGDEGPKPGHGGNYNAFVFFRAPMATTGGCRRSRADRSRRCRWRSSRKPSCTSPSRC